MLFVPSLKPIRLRGVLVLEVRPKPSWDHRITANPRPILARFLTAWKATCGSSAQAWTTLARLLALFNAYLLSRSRGSTFGDGFLRLEERVTYGEEVDQPHRELQEILRRVPANQNPQELPESARRAENRHLAHVPQRVEERRDDAGFLQADHALRQKPRRHEYKEGPRVLE